MRHIANWHFEFKDYKEAFKKWKSIDQTGMQFIVSTHPYSSGYWIERQDFTEGFINDGHRYSHEEVLELEMRIEFELERAINERSSPRLTL